MLKIIELKGITEFDEYVKGIDSQGPTVLFLFTGAKLPSGESWCVDCNDAQPAIEAFLSEIKKPLTFVKVDVGDRETWKKKDSAFRVDPRTKLMVIPTILRWKGVQKLEGEQCAKKELLHMLIEDEE